MKPIFFILFVLSFFSKNSICQNAVHDPYKGGVTKLNADLARYLSEVNIQFDDTAFLFILQISRNKSSGKASNKMQFDFFGKNSQMKKTLQLFINENQMKWNRRIVRKRNVILPIFISAFGTSNAQPYFDWRNIFEIEIPKNQIALFVSPVIIELHCCLSETNRDFQ
ncbi:MAG: hypothetical protein KAY50_05190 [Chitinophagaceae bacterium]|nr:hypothetical protein [Chitinophagaceae bacterium]